MLLAHVQLGNDAKGGVCLGRHSEKNLSSTKLQCYQITGVHLHARPWCGSYNPARQAAHGGKRIFQNSMTRSLVTLVGF